MAKIFDIYLAKQDQPESDAYAKLSLPATPCQIQDAFDKLRLAEGESLYWEITEYHHFEELSSLLNDTCGLNDLNALAQKLSELDERQFTAFAGLLKMEQQKGEAIPISRLIDLAYSTECCHVVDEALNDGQLGRFYVENEFVPEIDGLPEKALALLDYEQIGRNMRRDEGGVFVERSIDHPGGYVVQHDDLVEAYKTLDLTPKAPDYTILLEVSKGFFNDPGYDSGKTVQLKLPALSETLDAALESVEAWDWREVGWNCLDCRIPALTERISDAEEGIDFLNQMAQRLTDMEPKALSAYKALLEAMNCRDLQSAGALMDSLDQYIFSPQYSSPIEVAKGELSLILCEPDAATLAPHLNLYQYGQALIEKCGGVLTPYGLIEPRGPHMSPAERVMWGAEEQGSERSFRLQAETEVNGLCDDAGQPVQGMEESPQQGGMEMK